MQKEIAKFTNQPFEYESLIEEKEKIKELHKTIDSLKEEMAVKSNNALK